MEKIKIRTKKRKKTSLRKSFVYAVLFTVIMIVLLSGITIKGCVMYQEWLVPNSNEIVLNVIAKHWNGTTSNKRFLLTMGEERKLDMRENTNGIVLYGAESGTQTANVSVYKIENSFTRLSPKKQMVYRCSEVAMIVLPMLYSIMGILICAFCFYKKKLDQPIRILSEATDNIARQNLDFSVQCDSFDEMGILCNSFEKMRETLYENNKELWNMLEERRMLQASVAHDLRNPIAIIEGYAEYMQMNLPGGKLSEEQLLEIASNLAQSARRMENYTESIKDINKLEELKICRSENKLPELLNRISEELTVMAKRKNIIVNVLNSVPECYARIDSQVLYRIIENIFSNAIRFTKSSISLEFKMKEKKLVIIISDDGPGFSEKILKAKNRYMISPDKSGKHMGMGLVISNILCKKHGGELIIENMESKGAKVTCIITVSSCDK